MQDRQLYAQILGIELPWSVDHVELKLGTEAVHIYLKHTEGIQWNCPECGRECSLYDHQPERQWRHLDTCQYRTVLHAEPPRSNCPEHGARVVKMAWAEGSSRFTLLFERLVIDWLHAASQKAVGMQLGLSWDEVHAIMDRAVKRGLKRREQKEIRYLGVDEKAFRKGHRYLTIVNDLERGHVIYVAEDRKQSSLDGFWNTLTSEQLDGIEAVAMDMWDPFAASVRKHAPKAHIVFDKFHIASHLGEAVDDVRKNEHRDLLRQGDSSLTGSKYDWLRSRPNFKPKDWRSFKQLRTSALKTARAWALKETAMSLFEYRYDGSARAFFKRWYSWATKSRLEPMKKVARMLKTRLDNILTYLKHRITNAMSESLNSKIQWVKYTARGFRNKRNFINAIYFHCGGLDLAP